MHGQVTEASMVIHLTEKKLKPLYELGMKTGKNTTTSLFDIERKLDQYYTIFVPRKILRLLKHQLATTLGLPWLYGKISYAQEGEDLVLQKLFTDKKNGIYVDIGAHHPYRYSNTYWFYAHGWSGINIDATPGSMDAFKRVRQRDINLELAISNHPQNMSYYLFEDSALNTLSNDAAKAVIESKQSKLIRKAEVATVPLKEVLKRWLPKNKKIDFLSIDVEGADLQVLQSNDWKKYSPSIVLVEILFSADMEAVSKTAVAQFLKKQGYRMIARTFNTAFFRKINK